MSNKKNPLFSYLSEVRDEMSKVAWPTRDKVVTNTILVTVISLVVAAYLGGLDYIFTTLLQKVI